MKKKTKWIIISIVLVLLLLLLSVGIWIYRGLSEFSNSAMQAEIVLRIPGREYEYLKLWEASFLMAEPSCSVFWKDGWDSSYQPIGGIDYLGEDYSLFPFRDGNYDLEWLENGVTITCYTPDGEVIACETFYFPD